MYTNDLMGYDTCERASYDLPEYMGASKLRKKLKAFKKRLKTKKGRKRAIGAAIATIATGGAAAKFIAARRALKKRKLLKKAGKAGAVALTAPLLGPAGLLIMAAAKRKKKRLAAAKAKAARKQIMTSIKGPAAPGTVTVSRRPAYSLPSREPEYLPPEDRYPEEGQFEPPEVMEEPPEPMEDREETEEQDEETGEPKKAGIGSLIGLGALGALPFLLG